MGGTQQTEGDREVCVGFFDVSDNTPFLKPEAVGLFCLFFRLRLGKIATTNTTEKTRKEQETADEDGMEEESDTLVGGILLRLVRMTAGL